MELTESQILNAIMKWMQTVDADEMARISGEMFGGECFTSSGDIYNFKPNDNYSCAFDNIKES